jgi:molecular chaperone GrpE
MSHERDEARRNPAASRTTGAETGGPDLGGDTWPGPAGGPGSEELPIKQDSAPTQAQARGAGAGFGQPGQPDWPGAAEGTAPVDNGAGDAARQRDEYLDALLRLQAEFDNYRKRVQRQQREIVENAAASLVKKLLPVLDTADLALAHGGSEDVKQVAGALFDILSKEGLERIDPVGQPFDPAHHDGVAHEPVEGEGAPETPEVSEVLRAGYLWKGQVLRPAMVKVRG